MRTTIEIDDELMRYALELSGLPSKKAVIDEALRRYRRQLAMDEIFAMAGTVEFWPGPNPDEAREAAQTDIEIDDELMRFTLERSGLASKKAVVDEAMRRYGRYLATQDLLSMRGKVEFWDGYDGRDRDCGDPHHLDD